MFEEYCEEYCEKICELMEYLNEFLIEFMGVMRRRAVSDRARPSCRCCFRATCTTVSLSIWQSYSAKTCHLGLISHSILAASAPLSDQLESELPHCDLATSDSNSVSLTNVGST